MVLSEILRAFRGRNHPAPGGVSVCHRSERFGRIDTYMQERGIGYLADWRWVIDDLIAKGSRDPTILEGKEIVYSSDLLVIYRLGL